MKKTRYYQVADHVFVVDAEERLFELMYNYEPFSCEAVNQVAFSLSIGEGESLDYVEEIRQDDEGQEIVCGHTSEGNPVFAFSLLQLAAGWLVCRADYFEAQLFTTGYEQKFAVDNALMVLFALATARQNTALFHASTVMKDGISYLFLGQSGTGKSTHSALWLRYIDGTELVNDDNPVVRITPEGKAIVYGSPWSGKTPCYRNVSYPIGGMVQLSQAPYNSIRRLGGVEAYVFLMLSISGKRWDKGIADGLHQTENWLATHVPTWFLECLPNEEAAKLCRLTIEHG
ncbi:MAG: hypothetical protein J6U14_04590 [Bacteroidaceae bacterium]|nr:hypothetical protein [Bacteroidaceae bacterium]